MRQMPSVTVTTEPTLRASVAAAKFLMRALIRSLISEALMDMGPFPLNRQFCFEPLELALERAVDQQIARPHHRTADQLRVDGTREPHLEAQALAHRGGQALLLCVV